MTIDIGNLFESLPEDISKEVFSDIVQGENIKIERIMGKSGAKLAALRVKIYTEQYQWSKAKNALDAFYGFSPDANFAREMSPYLLKIDAGFKALKTREEAEQIAQIQRDKEAVQYAEKQRLLKNELDKKKAEKNARK